MAEAPNKIGTVVDLFIGKRSKGFDIEPNTLVRAALFSITDDGSYWLGMPVPHISFDDDGKFDLRTRHPWRMNPTTEELIEMGALWRPLPEK